MLAGEDSLVRNNEELYGFSDTSDFILPATIDNGRVIIKSKNMNWVVELDPTTLKATKKSYALGRFGKKGMAIEDFQNIYMSNGGQPSVLFMYTPHTAKDLEKGLLFFYKQNEINNAGSWMLLDSVNQDFDLLESITIRALSMEATMFSNLEGMTIGYNILGQQCLFIAEKGADSYGNNFKNVVVHQGKLARHLMKLDASHDDNFSDPFGRIFWMFLITKKHSA